MHLAMTIGFIIGCAGTVTPFYYENIDRQPRAAPAASAAPTAPAAPNVNYGQNNVTQLPYPTYPEYVNTEHDPTKESSAPVTEVPPANENTFVSESSNRWTTTSLITRARTYSNYVVQVLLVGLLGISLLNYICSYSSFCNVFGADSFWPVNQANNQVR